MIIGRQGSAFHCITVERSTLRWGIHERGRDPKILSVKERGKEKTELAATNWRETKGEISELHGPAEECHTLNTIPYQRSLANPTKEAHPFSLFFSLLPQILAFSFWETGSYFCCGISTFGFIVIIWELGWFLLPTWFRFYGVSEWFTLYVFLGLLIIKPDGSFPCGQGGTDFRWKVKC